ncbi:MAG: helix-turn-helix domain-containing protein [Candidatus Lokiarchaeota archaeon]|nr:helix-turn-helix domain-containing protein [Candidatus Lokiarchaeota archaeon]
MTVEETSQNMQLDLLLEMLGNPTRRMLLSKLSKVPHSASELANSLNISRQAVHSQLKLLEENGLIEDIDKNPKKSKYRIKKDILVRIDISPDYYNIKYATKDVLNQAIPTTTLQNTEFSRDYTSIKKPEEKIKFLGETIKLIENDINDLESERNDLLQKKQCCIIELKNLMDERFKNRLLETIRQRRNKEKLVKKSLNLGEEIMFTLFFNPEKYFDKINIDSLLDDLFSSDMDNDLRAINRVSVQPLLRDLSKLMGFLYEEDDDWFFSF